MSCRGRRTRLEEAQRSAHRDQHLREVINEQERMLEERRVGLISQEEVIKELRAEKERTLKAMGKLKAERDEAATQASRNAAQINGLEEENRRMGRLLVEAQTDSGRGGGQPDHMMKLQSELKDTRVELRQVQADRDRLNEQYDLAERDRQKLEGRLAQVEVDLQEAVHGKLAAESARNVARTHSRRPRSRGTRPRGGTPRPEGPRRRLDGR